MQMSIIYSLATFDAGVHGQRQCTQVVVAYVLASAIFSALADDSGPAPGKPVPMVGQSTANVQTPTGVALPDAKGPLRAQLPSNLCQTKIPPRAIGLPPDNPIALAEATTPEKQAVIVAYYREESLRSLQTQFCAPVIPETVIQKSKDPLPRECAQPPDPTALLNPIHPMADSSREDVKKALGTYIHARDALDALRRKCMALAGSPLPPVPQPSALPPPPMPPPPQAPSAH